MQAYSSVSSCFKAATVDSNLTMFSLPTPGMRSGVCGVMAAEANHTEKRAYKGPMEIIEGPMKCSQPLGAMRLPTSISSSNSVSNSETMKRMLKHGSLGRPHDLAQVPAETVEGQVHRRSVGAFPRR